MTRPNERGPGSKVGTDGIPGEVGFSFEEEPEKVQLAQPLHSLTPLRTNRLSDGVDFPSPHIQVDAQIGDSPPPPKTANPFTNGR